MTSPLYSSVELGRRLAAAGHQMMFAGPPEVQKLVEHHDLEFMELDPSRYDQYLEADRRMGTLARLTDLRARRERAVESLAVRDFACWVRDSKPDLMLINGEMHEHIIAGASARAPLAILNTFVSIWRQPGLPPPHHFVVPGLGWSGSKAGMTLLWYMLRFRKRFRAVIQSVRDCGCDRLSVLRHLSRESDFDLRREADASQWLIPFTYRHIPVLSLHALEFEFPHRPPQRVHYVGPMVLESRMDRSMSEEERARLDAIIERRRHGSGERKLIYAAFGSVFSSDLGLIRRLVGAVSERRDWELLISLSDRVAPSDLPSLPERVSAFSWLPQMEVLRHADVMVNHGGINTVDECVITGVPMLIYCGCETDMAGITARVVHHGIGIAGDRRRDDAAEIRARIERLLREPRFEENLERLRRSYEAYADRSVAEAAVERLLAREDDDRPS
jgi:UDP:flavonoid glycosyltransferase YjiC (YdhE family)